MTPQLTKEVKERLNKVKDSIELWEGKSITAEYYGLDSDDWVLIEQFIAEEIERARQEERKRIGTHET